MNGFRKHIQECMEGVPATTWDPNSIILSDAGDRIEINDVLAEITDQELMHPVMAYEQVSQALEAQGIQLPPAYAHADEFLETDGELVLPLVATDNESDLVFLYFVFSQNDDGTYDILAEIVTTEELEEILHEHVDAV